MLHNAHAHDCKSINMQKRGRVKLEEKLAADILV